MLGLVIKKEIHDNLLNARFVAACAISLVLIVSSIVVLTGTYEEQIRDYQSRVTQQDDFIDQYGHYNRAGWMARQTREPSHLQALVLGIDREGQQENFISNPVAALLSRLDFVSIVTIIMSLAAILFSYNAISGEREAGLLRQILSAGISRRTLIIGKFFGGTISLLIPFTISALVGMLFLALSPGLQIQSVDFAVLAALLILSWFYVSAFYGVGLLFSALSRTSGEAVLKSLFAWVILVLVIPNISPFLAAQFYPIPSAAKIQQETAWIGNEERDEIFRKRSRELLEKKYPDLKEVINMGQKEVQIRAQNDPSFRERYRKFSEESDEIIKEVNRQQQQKADQFAAVFIERSEYQQKLATIITSASPYANFVFAATDLSETGIEAEKRWQGQAGEYDNIIWKYAREKYEKEKEKNPAFDSNDYLNMRDRPRFQYQPSRMSERIENILPQVGILAIFNLLFFAGAFHSFQRYDVR